MPAGRPGPNRDVQAWNPTSDRPAMTREAASAAAGPARSCRKVTDRQDAEDADHDDGRLKDTGGDVSKGEGFALPLDDGKKHHGGPDIGDDNDDFEERTPEHAHVGTGPKDVAGVV